MFEISRVLRFSPADEKGETECYNPLDFVAIDPDQRDIDINAITAALLPTPKGDTYWVFDARALLAGVIFWVLENPDISNDDKNLGTVLLIMEGGDKSLRAWLEEATDPALRPSWVSSFTYTTLAHFAVMASKQLDAVYGALAAAVRPFKNNRILRATAPSTFDIRTMRRENMSLYLDFRVQQIGSIGPIFNVLMVQFMDYMSRTMMRPGERRVPVFSKNFRISASWRTLLRLQVSSAAMGCHARSSSSRFVPSTMSIRESRQTLVNSARVQIFLGAQDTEDQRYVSQLLGERKDVTIDKAVSTGATLFDQKSSTTSHRSAMRPDELGAMDETRCIIKIRNQQPIFGVRNVYYADRHLLPRAWRPLRQAKDSSGIGLIPATTDTVALETVFDHSRMATIMPGGAFADKHAASTAASANQRLSHERQPSAGFEDLVNGVALESPPPDFRGAMERSASRKASAERTLAAVLSRLEGTQKKRRAARKLRTDVAEVFYDD